MLSDLIRGLLWGVGFSLARVLWLPILAGLAAAGGWAFLWSSAHHMTFAIGLQHVAVTAVHAISSIAKRLQH